MKTKKTNNRENDLRANVDSKLSTHQKKMTQHKVKYRHQNHWLEEEDFDYEPPKYKDEQE